MLALNIADPDINPLANISQVSDVANVAVSLLILLSAISFVFVMLSGAFTYLTAGGDAEKVKTAQKTIKFALIGMFIVFVSYLMVKIIEYTFRINLPL